MKVSSKTFIISLLAASTPTSTAFVPLHPKTTTSQTSAAATPSITSRTGSPSSSTVLHMNLFDRFVRVAKSNLNNIASKVEDPEKIMNQAMIDMQNDLVKIRQSYAEATATQRRLGQQKKQADAVAADWYNRAQLALKRNHEGLAREALARRQLALEQAESLQQQMDAQASALDQLYQGMQALESKILEAKSKKDQLAARARTAKSTKQVNDMLAGLSGRVQVLNGILSTSSAAAFQRMEEKVQAMEAAAEASAEMRFLESSKNFLMGSTGDSKDNNEASLESQFRRLEQSDAIDKELAKLKQGLLPASTANISTRVPIKEQQQSLEFAQFLGSSTL